MNELDYSAIEKVLGVESESHRGKNGRGQKRALQCP